MLASLRTTAVVEVLSGIEVRSTVCFTHFTTSDGSAFVLLLSSYCLHVLKSLTGTRGREDILGDSSSLRPLAHDFPLLIFYCGTVELCSRPSPSPHYFDHFLALPSSPRLQ